MLAEAIAKVAELAKEGTKHLPVVMPHPTDLDKRLLLKDDNTYQIIDAPRVPPDRAHVVTSFKDLLTVYIKLATLHDAAGADGKPIIGQAMIWHDERCVQFFTDDPHRRNRVALPLVYSDVWHKVSDLEGGQAFDHKALVRLLRHDLAVRVDASVLAAFRSINFDVIQKASASIQHGSSKLDADLVAEVAGGSKPEGFNVMFDVLAMSDLAVPVTVGVTIDIDVQQRSFKLQTMPDELTAAKDRLREMVAQTLQNHLATRGVEGASVIAGTP